MKTKIVEIEIPEGCNVILGQTHFIKSVEDLYEALIESSTSIKFGLGFCEASGPCLVRVDGNDDVLKKLAGETALKLAAGHTFIIYLKDAFPINCLNRIKQVSEVCRIFCATANPVQAIIAETEQGRGILGVIDGFKSKGIESDADIQARKKFLIDIGYKR
ncbi:MAG: adenosine-specific kinase [Candidatus Heimdallarchaeota archaeon]